MADVGAHVRSYGFPPGHPAMTQLPRRPDPDPRRGVGQPLSHRQATGASSTRPTRRRRSCSPPGRRSPSRTPGCTAQTDQRRAELERSVRALEATSEIARAVGGETQLDRVLELIAKRSRALVEAAGVAILLSDGDDFVVAATAGEIPRADRRQPGQRERARSPDASSAPGRPERVSDVSSSLRFALGDLGVKASSGMFVPLQFRGASLGVIEAFDRAAAPSSAPRTSECCSPPRRARRPPSRPRSRSSRTGCGGP